MEAVAVAIVVAVVVNVDPEVVPEVVDETRDAPDDADPDAELADEVTEAELADDAEEAPGVLKDEMIPFPLTGYRNISIGVSDGKGGRRDKGEYLQQDPGTRG